MHAVVLLEELKVGISKQKWRRTRAGDTYFDFQYSRWQERQSDSLAEVAACPRATITNEGHTTSTPWKKSDLVLPGVINMRT